MLKRLKRLNEALPGLISGIILYGVLASVVAAILGKCSVFNDCGSIVLGIWLGVLVAIGMSVSLATVIYDTTTLYYGDAAKKMAIFKSIMRYLVVAIVFLLVGYFEFANVFAMVIGVFSIKFSAYMQRPLAGLVEKMTGGKIKAWVGDDEELLAEYQRELEEEAKEKTRQYLEESGQWDKR